MTQDQDAQLVRMVNQIAANLGGGRDSAEAAEGVCRHLETFWARPMKRRVIGLLALENSGLTPPAHRAVAQLASRSATETSASAAQPPPGK